MGKKIIKGYYLKLQTEMPEKEDSSKKEYRMLDEKDVDSLIKSIRDTPLTERFYRDYILTFRGDDVKGDSVDIPEYDGYECAMFMKRRNVDFPKTATPDLESGGITLKQLEIDDESYVMETTYLMINKKEALFLLMVNGNVCRGNIPLASYFGNFIDDEKGRYVEPLPIMNVDAFKRFDQLVTVKNAEVCVLGSIAREMDAEESESFSEIIRKAGDDENVNQINLKLSAKRGKSISKGNVRGLLKLVQHRRSKCEVPRFRITGEGEEGIETIDFINNDFIFKMPSEVSAKNLDPKETFAKMYENFEQNLKYIRRSLGL